MNKKFASREEFVRDGNFLRVANLLYDNRLDPTEEIVLIVRVFAALKLVPVNDNRVNLESSTLLRYICRYGFWPEVQRKLVDAAKDDCPAAETNELSRFKKLARSFIGSYNQYRDFDEELRDDLAELQRNGLVSLPECSEDDKCDLRYAHMHAYAKYMRFLGGLSGID